MSNINQVVFEIALLGFFYQGFKLILSMVSDLTGIMKKVYRNLTKKTFKFSPEQVEAMKMFAEEHGQRGMWGYITQTAGLEEDVDATINMKTGVLSYWGKKACPEEKVETRVAGESKK